MTEGYLTEEEGTYLVHLARHTISQALGRPSAEPQAVPPSERLQEPGAAFVTLHTRDDALRGCIGSLMARRPLVEDVKGNALSAAFEDPRFPPLTEAEFPNIVVEVSVLTTPVPLEYADAGDLISRLRPGVDGVIIEQGWHRATFLPQVWDQLPYPEEFLANLCYKAGLSVHAWREGILQVATYQVQKFEEPG